MFEASWVAVLGLDNSKSNELIGRVQPSFLQLIRETSTGVHCTPSDRAGVDLSHMSYRQNEG